MLSCFSAFGAPLKTQPSVEFSLTAKGMWESMEQNEKLILYIQLSNSDCLLNYWSYVFFLSGPLFLLLLTLSFFSPLPSLPFSPPSTNQASALLSFQDSGLFSPFCCPPWGLVVYFFLSAFYCIGLFVICDTAYKYLRINMRISMEFFSFLPLFDFKDYFYSFESF